MANHLFIASNIAFLFLLIGFGFAFVRLCIGPTLADRVVALDLMAFITIGFIGVYSIFSQNTAFLDIAITLALVAFLSTVAFARFIYSRTNKPQGASNDR